jgi:inorganic pyrophosphatase
LILKLQEKPREGNTGYKMNKKNRFWEVLDSLVSTSEIVIDRPKGTMHPRFTEFVYPFDYGYLSNTKSTDGVEIDVWRGTKGTIAADAVICTVDNMKRDSEVKILIGCTEDEKQAILSFHNSSEFMAGILVEKTVKMTV